MHIYIYMCVNVNVYIYIYDGLPKCMFLALLINHNPLRAASFLVFKTMTYQNCLKPCILSFTFETVDKTCSKCSRASA